MANHERLPHRSPAKRTAACRVPAASLLGRHTRHSATSNLQPNRKPVRGRDRITRGVLDRLDWIEIRLLRRRLRDRWQIWARRLMLGRFFGTRGRWFFRHRLSGVDGISPTSNAKRDNVFREALCRTNPDHFFSSSRVTWLRLRVLSPASAGRPPRRCGGAARWCAATTRGTDLCIYLIFNEA